MLIWPLACAQYARNSHQGASPLEMDWGKALRISRGGSPRVKNELCRAHPCAQEQAPHRCFLLAQRKRLAMYHHSLIFHDLLNSVMFQGKESHRLTRSSHNLCQPLPACSNASLRLHTVWTHPSAPYLQPELLYLLHHRGVLVPAAREKPVTDSLQIPIFLLPCCGDNASFQRDCHKKVTPGLPGSALLWEGQEVPLSRAPPAHPMGHTRQMIPSSASAWAA